jgi:SNF2 family DNA or RNA helicase
MTDQEEQEPAPKRVRTAGQVLYPHQQECVAWMKTRPKGGLLYLPPGMGKTLVAMTWARQLFDDSGDSDSEDSGPVMIIVPKTLLRQWEIELNNFGLPAVTLPTMQPIRPKMIVLMTYSQLQALYKKQTMWRTFCQSNKFKAFILDECHVSRNKDTILFKALLALTTTTTQTTQAAKWCMSGTPCVNWPEKDFGSMAALIGCDKRDIMAQNVFHREKSLLQLPPCTINVIKCNFSVRENKRYNDYRITTSDVILAKLCKLRAYCRNVAAKFINVKSIMDESAAGTKTLVFSESVQCLRNIQEYLLTSDHETLLFHGKMTMAERQATLAEFAHNPRIKALLLSIHSGGVGLNITCASNVILMDTQYADAFEQQAIDRAHRIGQTRPVHVYKLRMNDSVENWVQGLQNSKSTALTTFIKLKPPVTATAAVADAAEAAEAETTSIAQSLKKQQKDLFKQFVHCETTSTAVADVVDAIFVATENLFDKEDEEIEVEVEEL